MNSTPYSKEDSILKVSSVSIGLQSSELNAIKENLFSHGLSFAQSIFGKFHFFFFSGRDIRDQYNLPLVSRFMSNVLCRMQTPVFSIYSSRSTESHACQCYAGFAVRMMQSVAILNLSLT